MNSSEYAYRDAAELQATLAESLRGLVVDALAVRAQVCLVLAGGRTPLPLYRRLSTARIDWTRVTLVPSDERCVPHTHPACNLTALREAWSAAAGVNLLSLTTPDGDPIASEAHALAALAPYSAPFDLVLLGMGNDAHTASLFPGAPQLAHALADDAPDALRIDPDPLPPEAPFPRISLSSPRLRRTRQLMLVVSGDDKREALRRARASHDPLRTPVSALLHASDVRMHVHWSP
jgi:6-phosphogluconolactonase